jgi:RPA family protein
MTTLNRLLLITLFCAGSLVFTATPASASYHAHCTMSVQVVKKLGKAKAGATKLQFKVLKLLAVGGHDNKVCKKWVGKTLTRTVERAKAAKAPAAGKKAKIRYEESNSRAAPKTSRSWTLL